MTYRPLSSLGQCRACMRRREVFSCQRKGGGNYRTAPRLRSSSVCGECATDLLATASVHQTSGGWDLSGIRGIVATLDTDAARAAMARMETLRTEDAARRSADDAKMRPYYERAAERRQITDWVRTQATNPAMDATTCQVLASDLKRGLAGTENTGFGYDTHGNPTWPITMREQVTAYLTSPGEFTADLGLDQPTIDALVTGITAGHHATA